LSNRGLTTIRDYPTNQLLLATNFSCCLGSFAPVLLTRVILNIGLELKVGEVRHQVARQHRGQDAEAASGCVHTRLSGTGGGGGGGWAKLQQPQGATG